MTKHNDKTTSVGICLGNEEVSNELLYEIVGLPNLTAIETTALSGLRPVANHRVDLKVLVIDQKIEPRESETIWQEASASPDTLVVVIARTFTEQKRIAETSRRIVLGPDATGQQIAEAIKRMKIRRGQSAKAAFEAGVIWLDPATGRVQVNHREIKVPADELKLLTVMAADPYRLFPKEELVTTVLETKAIGRSEVRKVEQLAHRLRRTLANAGLDAVKEPMGVGFQLLPQSVAKRTDTPVNLKAAA